MLPLIWHTPHNSNQIQDRFDKKFLEKQPQFIVNYKLPDKLDDQENIFGVVKVLKEFLFTTQELYKSPIDSLAESITSYDIR